MAERAKLAGKKLKKFNFVKILGTGTYGTVYQAINQKTKQIVAIKVISKKDIKQRAKLKQLVESQIKVLSEVNNENVIKFVDTFSSNQSIFIATEYCNGGDLERYWKQKSRFEESEALSFLKQILNGFKGLHEVNSMHRDFKLPNVLLHNKVCKIADLGFSIQLQNKSLTTTVLGTDETMAPQVHEGRQYGWQADIWSIGVVFYQMLYGRAPFAGHNEIILLKNIKTSKPQYDDIPGISEQAIDFLKRCLTVDPKKRISWKEIYEHPLINRSQINLTTIRTSFNPSSHKSYYQKNQLLKRQTIKSTKQLRDLDKITEQNDFFGKQQPIHDGNLVKMQEQLKNKQLIDQYQQFCVNIRNDKMFGITKVLPVVEKLAQNAIRSSNHFWSSKNEFAEMNHSKPLYEICKNCFIQMKKFRRQFITGEISYRNPGRFKYWKQFSTFPVYKALTAQLLEDEKCAQALTVSFMTDLNNRDNQNIHHATSPQAYRNSLQFYWKQLAPFARKQDKKFKVDVLKMLKALQFMKDTQHPNSEEFEDRMKKFDPQGQQKRL